MDDWDIDEDIPLKDLMIIQEKGGRITEKVLVFTKSENRKKG